VRDPEFGPAQISNGCPVQIAQVTEPDLQRSLQRSEPCQVRMQLPQHLLVTQTDNQLSLSIKRPVSEGLEWISGVQMDGSPGDLPLPSRNVIRGSAPFGKQAQSLRLGDCGWCR
jgi:hypothetical protein